MILSNPVPLAPPYRLITTPGGPLEQAASEVTSTNAPARAANPREALIRRCILIEPPSGATLATWRSPQSPVEQCQNFRRRARRDDQRQITVSSRRSAAW